MRLVATVLCLTSPVLISGCDDAGPQETPDPTPPAGRVCLAATPGRLDFGAGPADAALTLTACGDTAVTVRGMVVEGDPTGRFTLSLDRDLPLALAPGASTVVLVTHTPAIPSVPAAATLRITNSGPSDLVVPLGAAQAEPCPVVHIACMEGDEVLPDTTLHCAPSYPGGAAPAAWSWRLATRPAGSDATIRPSTVQRDVTLTVDVVGTYTLELTPFDAAGGACPPARQDVAVTQDEAVHVELRWVLPSAISDDAARAADVALVVLHPDASGWFDAAHRLDASALAAPEDGLTYRLGVYYADDVSAGDAYTTLRVYVFGRLVWEARDVVLAPHDLWEVATIAWPSGEVQAIAAPPSILHGVTPRE